MPLVERETLVRVRGLTQRYPDGTDALGGIDLDLSAGETLALIGESGSGKTTLLRTLNRLVDPSGGEITLRGRDLRSLDPVSLRRGIGYVPQNGGLLPHWTVQKNVGLVPELLRWPKERVRARTADLLATVGLPVERFGSRYPRTLSGGQRQRVAFARALGADPELVLLDEPFGALDPLTREEMQREFLGWKTGLSKTLVLVTHDLDEAFRLADRVAVLYRGRIEQCAAPEALRAAPATEYVARLLERGGGPS